MANILLRNRRGPSAGSAIMVVYNTSGRTFEVHRLPSSSDALSYLGNLRGKYDESSRDKTSDREGLRGSAQDLPEWHNQLEQVTRCMKDHGV